MKRAARKTPADPKAAGGCFYGIRLKLEGKFSRNLYPPGLVGDRVVDPAKDSAVQDGSRVIKRWVIGQISKVKPQIEVDTLSNLEVLRK